MILDSSAIVAILLREPEHEALQSKLAAAPSLGVGTPTLLEAAIVLSARLERNAQGILARFIQETDTVAIPFSQAHYSAAHQAWLSYGKGRHPAGADPDRLAACAAPAATVRSAAIVHRLDRWHIANATYSSYKPFCSDFVVKPEYGSMSTPLQIEATVRVFRRLLRRIGERSSIMTTPTIEERLAHIESTMPHLATKEDVAQVEIKLAQVETKIADLKGSVRTLGAELC